MTLWTFIASQRGAALKLTGQNILIVEDCPDQQRLLAGCLRSADASVELECNGEAAVERVNRAAKTGAQFDAVVMDLFLEEMDGIRATEEILEIDPSIAVIAITGNATSTTEQRWRRAGCISFFEKPVVKAEFINAIAQGIALKQIERRLSCKSIP
jgi:CheY-like chemotaxis protein